jgi:N6-adenosine-specific RNA methylase IME4
MNPKTHPGADFLPMMGEHQLTALAADIKARGLIHPIVLFEGRVLDGRNRLSACELAGVKPRFVSIENETGHLTPASYVNSANAQRRHLSKSQLAMLATKLLPFFKKEALERQRDAGLVAAGKKKRQLRAPGRQARASEEAARKISALFGDVGNRTVQRAQAIAEADEELAEKVWTGAITVKQAEKQIRQRSQVAKAQAYGWPTGEYPVIMVDPPWCYSDGLEGAGMERPLPYPTMSIGEIAVMPLPCAADCAVFLWITNPMLIDPLAYGEIAREWKERHGLRPVQIRTWVKTEVDGGPFTGMGHVWRNDTEHLVRLERGRPAFNKVTQRTAFSAPVGRHSEKPAIAFDDVTTLCAATKRLEMFARAPRDGWVTSGSELAQPTVSGDASPAQSAPFKLEEAAASPVAAVPSFSPRGGLGTDDFVPPVEPASLRPVDESEIPF